MNCRQSCKCNLEKLSAAEGLENNSEPLHREGITSNFVASLKCLCSEITWFLVCKCSCLPVDPQILVEVSKILALREVEEVSCCLGGDQCFLHSSYMLSSGLLCILLQFGVNWDAFSPCFLHCERVSGLCPVRVFSAHFSSSRVNHGPFPLCLVSGYQGPSIWYLG